MKLSARCRHCGAARFWLQPDHSDPASVVPAANGDWFDETVGESSLCQLSPTGACEPKIITDDERRAKRISGELAEGMRRKSLYGPPSSKRRPKR